LHGRQDKRISLLKELGMAKKKVEKRKYPRVKDAHISLKVKSKDTDIITKSLDISASGVYCKLEKEMPLMSRIRIILIIPKIQTGGEKSTQNLKIETDGVVVREHPVIENGKIIHYDAAIFFDNISIKDRESILDYISSRTGGK